VSSWHPYFIHLAAVVASKSKDESTKVGCVIVGPDNEIRSTGFNGFPRGVVECDEDRLKRLIGNKSLHDSIRLRDMDVSKRWQRPEKYMWVEHAERNAIYNAARMGTSLRGCTAYMNFEPAVCTECAKGLIQSGIVRIIGPDRTFTGVGRGKFYDTDDVAKIMLMEAGVQLTIVPVLDPPKGTC
jgi:dCMP deaminase